LDEDNYNESNSNNENSDSNTLSMLLVAFSPDLLKRYEGDRCFQCESKGHQRDKCPQLKSLSLNNFRVIL